MGDTWKILIVDDEPSVHDIAHLVLDRYSVFGKSVEIHSAFSAREGFELLSLDRNFAMIILDVVMETERAGLDLVPEIRNKLSLSLPRIILSTGHSGSDPEDKILAEYDIGEYREKTEMTAQRLKAVVVSSIRSYMNLLEKNSALERLERAKDTLATVIEAIPAGVIATDSSLSPVLINSIAKSLSVGSNGNIWEQYPFLESVREGLETCLSTGAPFIANRSRFGNRYFDIKAGRIFDTKGNALAISFVDSTAAAVSEEKAHRDAKLTVIGEISAGIAHDINNLLGGIIGTISMYRNDRMNGVELSSAEMDELVSRIGASADSIVELTRRILEQTRTPKVKPEQLDAESCVRYAFDICRDSFDPTVSVQLAAEDEHLFIHADKTCFVQAILNLAINGAHAMTIMRSPSEKQGGKLIIRVVHADGSEIFMRKHPDLDPSSYAAVEVADEGVGMTPEEASRVFDPFFTTKIPGSGTGLGLSVTLKNIEQSGGRIDFETQKGKGTTFVISYPLDA